jgi:geranyl-CoA carboxylase alpha subunit
MTATPFHKVLIANRGEIALRVMRSAKAMGLRTVAVYASADAQARHVREADQAVCIGEALPAQSYLNIAAILDAARRTGADAVHPGYGFLAENAQFAQACQEAGLVFIGPSPDAIKRMGDKAGAKQLMMDAGVPCIPGYQGEDQSAARLAQAAQTIGYPVMIKATAGGGGRGMRWVERAEDFAELLHSAQSEALNAFGNATVILEKAVHEPRHIEIQILADRHGHAIHLGERDCSVQRRHQKLIEEAPSPAVNAALRERMGAVAVAAVQAMGYEGAGTLEFLLDAQGQFFFMEMNTRLQVEHPVTEAITGLDLVALQLRIAAGEPLALQQADVRFQGHAIEVRLCAEDAEQGFMPQSGQLVHWAVPPQLRVEHALQAGAVIPPYYDSMMAKFISHGENREQARRQLLHGLQDAVCLGVTSNQAFLAACLAHPVFAAGEATTGFIGQHAEVWWQTPEATRERVQALAAVVLIETAEGVHWQAHQRRMHHPLPIPVRLQAGDDTHSLSLRHLGERHYQVNGVGEPISVKLLDVQATELRFACNGVQASATWVRDGDQLWLHAEGQAWLFTDQTRAASQRQVQGGSDGQLRASMNGRVVAVMVAVGDQVRQGQTLFTLEAMKMEHMHLAPASGVVRVLNVAVGDQVSANRVVVEIEMNPTEVAS